MAFTTRKSLLEKVRAGDEVSWGEFYATYKPLILLRGNDCHLTPDENDELVQQVMCEIFRKDIIGKYDPDNIPEDIVFKYDPSHGRFRHYFRKIIRNQAVKILRKRTPHAPLEEIEGLPALESWDDAWEEEWKKHLLTMALGELKSRVRPESYVAFEMYALQGREVREIANVLNLSISSIYTAKSRCIAQLREILSTLEEK